MVSSEPLIRKNWRLAAQTNKPAKIAVPQMIARISMATMVGPQAMSLRVRPSVSATRATPILARRRQTVPAGQDLSVGPAYATAERRAALDARIDGVKKSLGETFAPFNLAHLGQTLEALSKQVEALTAEVADLKGEKSKKAAKLDQPA